MDLLALPNDILSQILSNLSDHDVLELVRNFPQFLRRVNPISLKDYYTVETIHKRTNMNVPTQHFRFNLYPDETPENWNINRIRFLDFSPAFKANPGVLTPDDYRNTTFKFLNLENLEHLKEVEAWFQLDYLFISKASLAQLPSDFGSLTQLTYLSLRGLRLESIPDLSGFAHLRNLTLSDLDLTQLPSLPNSVVALDISGNPDLDIDLLEPLPNLSFLDIPQCGLKDLFPLFKFYPSLEYLNANGNQISKIDQFPSWPELTSLYLINNQLTTLPSFDPLPKLKKLNISGNNIKSYPSSLYDRSIEIDFDSITEFDWRKLPFDVELTHFPIEFAIKSIDLISSEESDEDLTELWKFVQKHHPAIFKSLPIPSREQILSNLEKFTLPQLQRLALKLNTPYELSKNNIRIIFTGEKSDPVRSGDLEESSREKPLDLTRVSVQTSTKSNNFYTVKELQRFCQDKGIDTTGTKAELVSRLMIYPTTESGPGPSTRPSIAPSVPEPSTQGSASGFNPARVSVQTTNKLNKFYTVEELKQFCRQRGLSTIGTKAELVSRLI